MARKKRRRDDESLRRRPRPAQPDDLLDLHDPRATEGAMFRMLGFADEESPLVQAQELMYQAFAERDVQSRIERARQALALCPDCADACVLLAEHAPGRKEALACYEQGVAAGQRSLGEQTFHDESGRFWGILQTRPYMRARLGLACTLWTVGRRAEAVQHAQELLRLNSGDNQGVRYTLAGWLLALDRDDELERLLQAYPEEGSATWAYTRALLTFRKAGDTPEACQLLAEAREGNVFVPAYLVGWKFPPAEQPSHYSPGQESEAQIYVGGFLSGWKNTPGAIAWLRGLERSRRKPADKPQPRGPLGFIKKWLKARLPQQADVWQAECRQTPGWLVIADEKVRPWMTLVVSCDELVLAHDLLDEPPSARHLWDTLVQAMQNPAAGEPHRPAELQVRGDDRWESLRPHLAEIGVNLTVTEELAGLDAAMASLGEHLSGKAQPGLLDMPGVGPEQVRSFYEAAAFFFQQAPWRKVGYETAIKVECARFQSGPHYAVLMGQSGLTLGVALYEDLDQLKGIWTQDIGDDANARRSVATTITFGEEWDIPVADLEAARRFGWSVARPDAYPSVFHKERGMTRRPPLAWELELLEGCLRAIPGFVDRHRQDDPTREEVRVAVGTEEVTLGLSWVQDVSE